METGGRTRRTEARARAHEAPELDPAVVLLMAVVAVLLALAAGTGLFLVLPAAL